MASMIVRESADTAEAVKDFSTATIELVGRGCKLAEYQPIEKVPSFEISGDLIAFASPDSTYAVTKKLLDGAKKSILIGIYDFTAE
jgi:hypothetical protein